MDPIKQPNEDLYPYLPHTNQGFQPPPSLDFQHVQYPQLDPHFIPPQQYNNMPPPSANPNYPQFPENYQYNPQNQFVPPQHFPDMPPHIDAPQFHEVPQYIQAPTQTISRNVVLQNLHCNAKCPKHIKENIKHVCKAPACQQRLLCDECLIQHNKKFKDHTKDIGFLIDLFDDTLLLQQFDNLCNEKEFASVALDDLYQRLCTSIIVTFDSLRKKVAGVISSAENKAHTRAKDFLLGIKDPQGWGYLKADYINKRESYTLSKVGVQTKELDSLIDTLNKIEEKQKTWDTAIQKVLKIQKDELDNIVNKVQTQADHLVNTIFPKQNQETTLVLEPPRPIIKIASNTITYSSEAKATHKFMLNAMTYLSKPDRFVTSGDDGSLTLWNPSNFTAIDNLKVHKDAINALLYVEKENSLFTASNDKTIRVIPVTDSGLSMEKPELFTDHSAPVKSLLYLEGEGKLVSAGEDADLRIWGLKTRSLEGFIDTKGWKTCGSEMLYIKPEKWIVVAGRKDIRIYGLTSKQLLMSYGGAKITGSMSFMVEKRFIVVQDDDDRIVVLKIDHEKRKLKQEMKLKLPASVDGPIFFKCIEDSNLLLVSTGTKKVAMFSLLTGKIIKEFDTKLHSTTGLSLVHRHRRIVVGDGRSNLIGLFKY